MMESSLAGDLRDQVKRFPIVGPALHSLYLRAFRREGELMLIQNGRLKGRRWLRLMRTHNDEYVSGAYEESVQDCLASVLTTDQVFYDIGANVGFFSLLAATIVGCHGRVVSIEPHPLTAGQLVRQMRVNGYDATVLKVALSDYEGTGTFDDSAPSVMASLKANTDGPTITVPVTTLDNISKSFRTPDVIKIDVEGEELQVLDGARHLLEEHHPTLIVELHSSAIVHAYNQKLEQLGYRTVPISDRTVLSIFHA